MRGGGGGSEQVAEARNWPIGDASADRRQGPHGKTRRRHCPRVLLALEWRFAVWSGCSRQRNQTAASAAPVECTDHTRTCTRQAEPIFGADKDIGGRSWNRSGRPANREVL